MLLVHEKYQSSFDTATKCAVECEHCAQACMGSEKMNQCVRYCLDCAEMCRTISTYMVRGSDFVAQATKACAEICEACAKECESHDSEHCAKCAKACREAVDAYQKIASVAA